MRAKNRWTLAAVSAPVYLPLSGANGAIRLVPVWGIRDRLQVSTLRSSYR